MTPSSSSQPLPIISVVTVNYNTAHHVLRSLETLSVDTHPRIAQAIIIDNNSSDDSKEQLAHLQGKVKIEWNQHNIGFGRANNQAIKQVESDYVCLVNPDVRLTDKSLTTMAEYLDAHPDVAAVGCAMVSRDGEVAAESFRYEPTKTASIAKYLHVPKGVRRALGMPDYYMDLDTLKDQSEPVVVDILSGACMVMRVEAFREVGGFDPDFFLYWEDTDLSVRLRQKGWALHVLPNVEAIHFKTSSQSRQSAQFWLQFGRSMRLYFKKRSQSST
jgi:GT2 family glycosyltransferase